MNVTRALSMLLALCFALASLPAQFQQQREQNTAPKPTKVTIHTVLRSDGLPVPGVPVYVVDQQWRERPKDDGWLRTRDNRVARLAASQLVSSDPNGVVTLTVPNGELRPHLVSVGSGFGSGQVEKVDGKWLLRVDRLDQYAVRAVDEAGRPMAHFAVALHVDGYDRVVELTDARGIAVFGAKKYPNKVIAAPAGWVGSVDGFPVITAKSSGRAVKLVVPPFGTVRLRVLREGKPAPHLVFGGALGELSSETLKASGGRSKCRGVEFTRVPVRGTLRGKLRAGPVSAEMDIVGPRKAGEVLVVDVETDPIRPKLTFKVAAKDFGQKLPKSASVRVRAKTDAGWFEEGRVLGADGRALLTFGRKPLQGDRLLRLEVELILFTSNRKWGAKIDLDQPLPLSLIDLGNIELLEEMPTLRGRVVDWRGQPVAHAAIDIRPEPGVEATHSYRTFSDAQGYFLSRSKPFRKPNGELARMVAEPSHGRGTHARYGDPSKPVPVGGDIILTLRRPSTGYVEVSFPDRMAVSFSLLQFSFLTNKGERHNLLLRECRRVRGTQNTYHVGPLPPGRGKLLVCLHPGCELLRFEDVDIAADEVCRDERLRNLVLSELVTTAKLRVVDETGRALPGARIHYSKGTDTISSGSPQTDTLEVTVAKHDDRQLKVTAEGKEPVILTDVTDGAVVRMGPRKRVRVSVVGLPADLPRDRLAVMFRSVERTNLQPWQIELLGEGDFAKLPVPAYGGYYLRLVVVKAANDPNSGWSWAGQSPETVIVGNFELKPMEFSVTEADLKRLRKLLR
jgi:hypothetical protein